ncbi:MAG TPA: hypothetical protein VNT01_13225 [Symbiobacteriaceae bacterium]|nr:hypothetical protein [Symbiobacteriaceae bacterium]
MNDLALQKFQSRLQSDGIPGPEAAWLAQLWADTSDLLKCSLGLGAMLEGEDIMVYIHVGNKPGVLQIPMGDLESMMSPAWDLAERVRNELLAQ